MDGRTDGQPEREEPNLLRSDANDMKSHSLSPPLSLSASVCQADRALDNESRGGRREMVPEKPATKPGPKPEQPSPFVLIM